MNGYDFSADKMQAAARIPVTLTSNIGEAFYEMALEMVNAICEGNAAGRRTVFICPVGPVGQYPIFVRLVNEQRLDLSNCWFFNMDEYLDGDGHCLPESHPLSFHGFMAQNVYGRIDPALIMPPEQRIFPDPADPSALDRKLEELGGADIAFGGIGINGHLAFNEARDDMTPAEFAELGTRIVRLSPETRTANAIGDLGGAIDAMPVQAVTIGIKQILAARKVRLGVFRDWHRAVLRQAVLGPVTAHFPVSLLQEHPDARIYAAPAALPSAF